MKYSVYFTLNSSFCLVSATFQFLSSHMWLAATILAKVLVRPPHLQWLSPLVYISTYFPSFGAFHSRWRKSHHFLWHGLIPGPWLGEQHCLTLLQPMKAFHVPLAYKDILKMGRRRTILTTEWGRGTWTGSWTPCTHQNTYRCQCQAVAVIAQPLGLWAPSILLASSVILVQPPAECCLDADPVIINQLSCRSEAWSQKDSEAI